MRYRKESIVSVGRILDSGREAKGRDTTLSKEVTFSVAVLLFISDRFITDGLHTYLLLHSNRSDTLPLTQPETTYCVGATKQ